MNFTPTAWRCLRSAIVLCAVTAFVSAPAAAKPVSPKTIPFITVPPVVGAVFALDGTLITTGADGTATLPHERGGGELARLRSVSPGVGLDNGKAEYIRLLNSRNSSGSLIAYALFQVYRDVSFTFRDTLGHAVPADRVTSLLIKSSIGETFTVTGEALKHPVTLLAERAAAGQGTVQMKQIYYLVEEVIITGSNTVFRSQQKFFPDKVSEFEVAASFYTLTIRTTDTLFDFATGDSVAIRWPDQHVSTVAIHNGVAVVPALPRGDYEMRIEGAGAKTWRPISVSRDQTVQLELISYVDGFAVAMLIAAVAVVGIVVGRRRLGRAR